MQRKRHLWIWVIIVVLLIGLGAWLVVKNKSSNTQRADQVESSSNRSSATKRKTVVQSQSKKETAHLSINSITPEETALVIAYYGAKKFNDSDGWSSVYNQLSNGTLKLMLSSKYNKELAKPGTGVQYVFVKKQSDTSKLTIRNAPSYTLENDQTVNFYQPYNYENTIHRVSLEEIIDFGNEHEIAGQIKQREKNVTLTDVRKTETNNTLTENDLNDDANYLFEKALVFYGTQRGTTDEWKSLKKMIAEETVKLEFSGSASEGTEIVLQQAGSTGALIFYESASTGHPALYNFGHLTGTGEDDYKFGDTGNSNVGYTVKELLPYINSHGGRAAVEKMPIDQYLP